MDLKNTGAKGPEMGEDLGPCSLIVKIKRVDKMNPEAVVIGLGLSHTG